LTGGAAAELATVAHVDIVNNHRNLGNDGASRYRQGVDPVRKMPIRGGAISMLDRATPSTPTPGIACGAANDGLPINDKRYIVYRYIPGDRSS